MAGRIDSVILGIDSDLATRDIQFTLTLDTLATGVFHRQRAAFDIDISAVLILVVSGLTSRGSTVKLTLDALVTHATDAYRATLHEEILIARDAVFLGLSDVEREVLDADIVATLDGVLGLARHVESAIALQLNLSLAVDATRLRAIGAIGKGVHRVLLGTDLDALAIGDVEAGATGIGHRETIKGDGALIRTIQ